MWVMKKKVPKSVRSFASSLGYNGVDYCGKISGEEYYGVGIVDADGMPVPTGLPTFIKYDGEKCELVYDADFKVSSRLS